MGAKRTGLLSVAEDKYFTTKSTLRKVRGKPRLDIGIKFVIYAKVDYLSRKRKNIPLESLVVINKIKKLSRFNAPHFKKQKGYTYNRAMLTMQDDDWIKNFYKNNIVRPRLTKKLKFS